MSAPDARRLKELKTEKRRLKKLLAERTFTGMCVGELRYSARERRSASIPQRPRQLVRLPRHGTYTE
jgi:hypothetical protein